MNDISAKEQLLGDAMGLAADQSPFFWQKDLLAEFIGGNIPSALDIPTGLGKTSVMAIWLVARACGAGVPRRLVYIVDRRAVVDQATSEAQKLREFVKRNPEFAKQLGLGGDQKLRISTLRGQHVDNREWLASPATPAIVVGTVDMIGSRLLFEGYGVTPKMRSFHAGMLGMDTLFVLDEAHLVPPFEALLEDISGKPEVFLTEEVHGIQPLRLITLSATGREKDSTFTLPEEDLKRGTAAWKRLSAEKKLNFIDQPEGVEQLSDFLAEKAWELGADRGSPTRVIVFCDKRKTAEAVAANLKKREKETKLDSTVSLLVGGRRVLERSNAFEMLNKEGWLHGGQDRPLCPRFLICTSAGEVGVDIDADHMVCDLVAWERMIQRFGRVNRRGHGRAVVIVVIERTPDPTAAVKKALAVNEQIRTEAQRKTVEAYQQKCEAVKKTVFRRPIQLLPDTGEGYDVSPLALMNLKSSFVESKQIEDSDDKEGTRTRAILDAATTAPPLRPALILSEIEAWSMTSLAEHSGRAHVQPWLRGWEERSQPQTKVVWRKWMPSERFALRFFDAAPVQTSETLETETYRVLDWMGKRVRKLTKKTSDLEGFENSIAFIIDSSGKVESLKLGEVIATEKAKKEEINKRLANATVVLDAEFGGLSDDGMLDAACDTDVHAIDSSSTSEHWLPSVDGKPFVMFRILETSSSSDLPKDRTWFNKQMFLLGSAEESDENEEKRFLVVQKWKDDGTMEDDRAISGEQGLEEHQKLAEKAITDISKELGLPEPVSEALGFAARYHDMGKDSTVWQTAFNAPPQGRPYAKTKGPINQAKLAGYRHELISMIRAKERPEFESFPPEMQELILHVIAAHHGFARPVIGIEGSDEYPPSTLRDEAKSVAVRFTRLQKRYGPWGLAWLEALLRSADHQASGQIADTEEGSQDE